MTFQNVLVQCASRKHFSTTVAYLQQPNTIIVAYSHTHQQVNKQVLLMFRQLWDIRARWSSDMT